MQAEAYEERANMISQFQTIEFQLKCICIDGIQLAAFNVFLAFQSFMFN